MAAVNIDIDTTSLDAAIEKAKKLKEILAEINELLNELTTTRQSEICKPTLEVKIDGKTITRFYPGKSD